MGHEEERVRLALEASGLGTWEYNVQTGEVVWDETLERLFGLAPGSFDGTYEAYLSLLHPEDREGIVQTVRHSLESGGSHRVEHRVIWPDGSIHWLEGWGKAVLDGDGTPTGLVGVSLDVTARRRRELRLRQLQEVTSALAQASTINQVGEVAIRQLLVATDAVGSTLILRDEQQGLLRVAATSLPEAQLPEAWRVFGLDSPISGAEAIRTGRVVIRPVEQAEGPTALIARMRSGDVSVVVALPLRSGERTLGAIGLALSAFDRDDDESMGFLRTLSGQLGQALERVTLHEAELAVSARLRLLADAADLLGSSLDYRQTVSQVASAAVPGFADWCTVDLLDEDGELQLLAVAHVDPQKIHLARKLRADYPPDPDAPSGAPAVVRTGTSELIPEISPQMIEEAVHRFPELAELIAQLELTSAMTVPLIARGRILGAISFVWGESGRRYDADDLAAAEELGNRAAIAIDNARLFDAQRRVADTLQASLRPPSLPTIPGLEVAAQYRPGGIHGEVAGDFYDVFEIGEGSWLAIVGDVCGKGVDAAAVMALARYTVRTAALTQARPSGILATLNEALLRADLDRFCTACAVRIDRASEEKEPVAITLASGGHPQPVLVEGGRAAFVQVLGTLLGVFEHPDLSDVSMQLPSGASLILYTDGVTETRRDRELFGDERLLEVARAVRDRALPNVLQGIVEAVQAFSPGAAADDIALLAIRNPQTTPERVATQTSAGGTVSDASFLQRSELPRPFRRGAGTTSRPR